MYRDEYLTPSADSELERRVTNPHNRMLGRVIACSGSRATISAVSSEDQNDIAEQWSVGRIISISVGQNRVVALAYSMRNAGGAWVEGGENAFEVEAEILGEIRENEEGKPEFSSGLSRYPYLGAVAHRIRSEDLRCIYDTRLEDTCVVGRLTQDETIDATIHIPSMLSKHFAIVGSTGVGKSTAVSLLLHKAIASDPKLRVLILDPHNEFAAAFPDTAVVIDTDSLDLPFWLMRLEEFAEVLFRGRPAVPEELDFLRDLIPEAKKSFRGESALMRRGSEKNSMTADTPVPYRMADLLALIDDRIGKLEGRNEKPFLRSLKMRILSAINDPRYHFMFSNNTISDTIMETVAHIFRIPGDDRPISTFQLSGIPSEVVNSVASVLCRMAFELALWSNGAIHMLVVCEEAHRYVPADPSLGFFPTRQAIARIAKEGRKYGVSLGVITQRPGELDQTILSQCSTLFAMRLSNDRDQEIIRCAIPNSSESTTSFLSSIGNGEAIAFGEAIAIPMRMRFERVAKSFLPKANATINKNGEEGEQVDLRRIVGRMRALGTSENFNFQGRYDQPYGDMPASASDENGLGDEGAYPYQETARAPAGWDEPARREPAVAPAPTFTRPDSPLLRPRPEPSAYGQYEEPMRRATDPAPLRTEPASLDPYTNYQQANAGLRPRDPSQRSALRESILRKPLSSLRDPT